jgi:hypothetical protein
MQALLLVLMLFREEEMLKPLCSSGTMASSALVVLKSVSNP